MIDRIARKLGLAPDGMSVALFLVGVAVSLGAASLGLRPRGTADDAMMSAAERARWQISAEGGGLSSVLYLGHLLGPMLVLASLVHARARQRESLEDPFDAVEDDGLPPARLDGPHTLRRISLVVKRDEALAMLDRIRTAPEHAHDAISTLSAVIERTGEIEHDDHVLETIDTEQAIERERAGVERRLFGASSDTTLATYRESETLPNALAGEHAILSWILVTRSELDPLTDVPSRGATTHWLAQLVPLRPDETVAVEAFVTPRHSGADRARLVQALSLERLRRAA